MYVYTGFIFRIIQDCRVNEVRIVWGYIHIYIYGLYMYISFIGFTGFRGFRVRELPYYRPCQRHALTVWSKPSKIMTL